MKSADLLISVADKSVPQVEALGFRFGAKGAHTSRTMMFQELETALATCNKNSDRSEYASEIVEYNILSKKTLATRKLTNQRLGELYGLDNSVPLFRIMRELWQSDERGRPLLALLTALARDPLLRMTAGPILSLPVGRELTRSDMTQAIQDRAGDRLNDSILDKVVRNASSSWTQSGHLEGRVRKIRQPISPTPYVAAYALILSYFTGTRGSELFTSGWVRILDAEATIQGLATDAKRLGLLDMQDAGGMLHFSFDRILTAEEKELAHGAH